jgi:hypothetical protein
VEAERRSKKAGGREDYSGYNRPEKGSQYGATKIRFITGVNGINLARIVFVPQGLA